MNPAIKRWMCSIAALVAAGITVWLYASRRQEIGSVLPWVLWGASIAGFVTGWALCRDLLRILALFVIAIAASVLPCAQLLLAPSGEAAGWGFYALSLMLPTGTFASAAGILSGTSVNLHRRRWMDDFPDNLT